MTSRRLRIAVSGPAGAGKTTLVKALAGELSLPILNEDLLGLYEAQVAFQRIAAAADTTIDLQRSALETWKKSFFDWCDARELAYAQHPDFVADRWELDIFGYWLHAFVQIDTYEDTRRLQELFLRRGAQFNLLVMLPVGDFPVEARNEDGLKRQTSYNRSVLTQSSFTGLLSQVPGSMTTYAPLAVEPVEKRVADIVRLVEKLQPD